MKKGQALINNGLPACRKWLAEDSFLAPPWIGNANKNDKKNQKQDYIGGHELLLTLFYFFPARVEFFQALLGDGDLFQHVVDSGLFILVELGIGDSLFQLS